MDAEELQNPLTGWMNIFLKRSKQRETTKVLVETDQAFGVTETTITEIPESQVISQLAEAIKEHNKKTPKQPEKVVCSLCGRERDSRAMKAALESEGPQAGKRFYTCRKTETAEDGTVKCFVAKPVVKKAAKKVDESEA